MFTLQKIDKEIIHSLSAKPSGDFVAAAVAVDSNGTAFHAGLVISYGAEMFVFHYTGASIILQPIPTDTWYFHKHLAFIHEEEVPAFIVHCQSIGDNASPKYGYFYGGDYYVEGKFFSESGASEIMTCSGFCLNVILGFIEADRFLVHEEWEADDPNTTYKVYLPGQAKNLSADEYLEYYTKAVGNLFSGAQLNDLKKNLRRIYPDQYLASGFFDDLPIKKSQIDTIIDDVRKVLVTKSRSLVLQKTN